MAEGPSTPTFDPNSLMRLGGAFAGHGMGAGGGGGQRLFFLLPSLEFQGPLPLNANPVAKILEHKPHSIFTIFNPVNRNRKKILNYKPDGNFRG